ncbi:DUF4259 domain-containing protein [Promicromonospora thailandica]|uniref:DUF4259 domain-containing protein n=1 Tax=Promicromonospora thailandica TaxID=765201 RepID=UPI0020A336AF|nr:DUF4259 domain-containing protein [Promicromonospora thailandica]
MGAWGTGLFENDSALDLLDDIVLDRFELDDLRRGLEEVEISHEVGCGVLTLIELTLAGHGLREMPVTDGMTRELIHRTIDGARAAWLLDQTDKVLRPGSEEYDLWHEAGPEIFREWLGHANAAVADLRQLRQHLIGP